MSKIEFESNYPYIKGKIQERLSPEAYKAGKEPRGEGVLTLWKVKDPKVTPKGKQPQLTGNIQDTHGNILYNVSVW